MEITHECPEWHRVGKDVHYRKCPRCPTGMLNMRVSRGAAFKLFLGWLPVRRYQCSTCSRRFYVRSHTSELLRQ